MKIQCTNLILLVIKFETIKSYMDKLHMYLPQQAKVERIIKRKDVETEEK
jgi:hypothetical protein